MKKHPEAFIHDCTFREEVRLWDLQNAPALIFVNCKFKKGINAREAHVGRSLKLIKCDIEPIDKPGKDIAFDLKDACLEGELLLYNCRIGGRFFAPSLRTKGNVRLRGCRIAAKLDNIGKCIRFDEIGSDSINELLKKFEWNLTTFGRAPAISLDGAEIEGDLEVTAAVKEAKPTSNINQALWVAGDKASAAASISVIDGYINAIGIVVHGMVNLFGTLCKYDVNFNNCHCHQDVLFYCYSVDSKKSHFWTGSFLRFTYAIIDKSLDLHNVRISDTSSFYASTIGGNVNVLGAQITTGDLNLNFATVRGFLTAFRTADNKIRHMEDSLFVGGDFLLSGAKINMIEVRGARIDRKIVIKTGTFGRIFFSLGVAPSKTGDKHWVPKPCRAAEVYISAIEVEETLDVSGLEVKPPKFEELSHLQDMKEKKEIVNQDTEGFLLTQSRIGKGVNFFMENPYKTLLDRFDSKKVNPPFVEKDRPKPEEYGARIDKGALNLQANKIEGTLDLRHLEVKHGSILLNDTTIGLELRMDGLLKEKKNKSDTPREVLLETTCWHLDAEKLQCGGDVDLTGLRIWPSDKESNLDDQKRGALLARGANIKGELLFLPRKRHRSKNDEDKQNYAQIDGEIDLTGIEASHLVISGDNMSTKQKMQINGKSWIQSGKPMEINKNGFKEVGSYKGKTVYEHPENRHHCILKIKDNKYQPYRPEKRIQVNGENWIEYGDPQPINGKLVKIGMSNNKPVYENPADKNLSRRRCYQEESNSTKDYQPYRQGPVLSLARGCFGRLEIVKPPTPGPIDLYKISVDRWMFTDHEGTDSYKENGPIETHYIDVLKRMEPFDRTTWIDVETDLRNKAHEKEANKVYRAMRWEERERKLLSRFKRPKGPKRKKQFLEWSSEMLFVVLITFLFIMLVYQGYQMISMGKIPIIICIALVSFIIVLILILSKLDEEGLSGFLTRFGTVSWWPMFLALILFPISLAIFSHPEFVRATPELLAVLKDEDRKRLDQTSSLYNSGFLQHVDQNTVKKEANEANPLALSDTLTGELTDTMIEGRPIVADDGIINDMQDTIKRNYSDNRPGAATVADSEEKEKHLNKLALELSQDELGQTWAWHEALALTLRYQVPIIPSVTHDWWEAGNEMVELLPFIKMRAEQYALWLEIYHWVAWPLFLIWVAARVVRGRQS